MRPPLQIVAALPDRLNVRRTGGHRRTPRTRIRRTGRAGPSVSDRGASPGMLSNAGLIPANLRSAWPEVNTIVHAASVNGAGGLPKSQRRVPWQGDGEGSDYERYAENATHHFLPSDRRPLMAVRAFNYAGLSARSHSEKGGTSRYAAGCVQHCTFAGWADRASVKLRAITPSRSERRAADGRSRAKCSCRACASRW